MVLQFSFYVMKQLNALWCMCFMDFQEGKGKGIQHKTFSSVSSLDFICGSQFQPWKITSLQKMFWNVQFSQQLQAWNHQAVAIKIIVREHSHETFFMNGMWRLVYCCFRQKPFKKLENPVCLDWSLILQPPVFLIILINLWTERL